MNRIAMNEHTKAIINIYCIMVGCNCSEDNEDLIQLVDKNVTMLSRRY